LEGV
jgi:hypothetical protein